jgi:hypothetical protein
MHFLAHLAVAVEGLKRLGGYFPRHTAAQACSLTHHFDPQILVCLEGKANRNTRQSNVGLTQH